MHCYFREGAYAIIFSFGHFVLFQRVYLFVVRDSLLIFIGFVRCFFSFFFYPPKNNILVQYNIVGPRGPSSVP